ncbi:MAG: PQQ-dependent sugar dehydrogenase, partial [Verrucomicrobiota bacterium]
PLLSLTSETPYPAKTIRELVLHPRFLDRRSKGYGRIYFHATEDPREIAEAHLPEYDGGLGLSHDDVIYEFRTTSPVDKEWTGSMREVMRLRQPGPEHNFGDLAFDLGGNLFVSTGDGAAPPAEIESEEPPCSRNAASLTSVFGKVLRIDPISSGNGHRGYATPMDNPFFYVAEVAPEIWASGLRSPYSLHFDRYQGRLLILDRIPSQSDSDDRIVLHQSIRGAEHFGWDLIDLATGKRTNHASLDGLITPPLSAIELPDLSDRTSPGHDLVLYRGERFPALTGKILIRGTDGSVWIHSTDRADSSLGREYLSFDLDPGVFVSGLTAAPSGELVIWTSDGEVYDLVKPDRETRSDGRSGAQLICLVSDI